MIELLSSGFYTSIQDLGRFNFTAYGVPISGAMDQNLLGLANLLVGNSAAEAAIEMTLSGPKFKFHSANAVAISAVKAKAELNNQPVPINHQIKVESGDILTIRQIQTRAYLATSGGFNAEKKLNSCSQYAGITSQQKLSKGDTIALNNTNTQFSLKHAGINYDLNDYKNHILEVYPLPEFESLKTEQRRSLTKDSFTVASESNRMAFQFEELLENQLSGIRSKPVMPGTVQLTPNGKLIVLMRDAQVTGGYPRIFQLSENSVNRLSQKPPKSKIQFQISKKSQS